ncbi:MAG: hypothetical protein ACOYLE_02985 [Bacteroidales bacterium]
MKFFDYIVIFWFFLSIISFFAGIIGLFSIYHGRNSAENPKFFYKLGAILLIQLVICYLILFLLNTVFKSIAKNDLLSKIESKEMTLKINSQFPDIQFKEQLLSDLKKINNYPINHSSPIKEIKIEISTKSKTFYVNLGRDSNDSTLYWVFINNYRTTKTNEIGKIKTKLLDKY